MAIILGKSESGQLADGAVALEKSGRRSSTFSIIHRLGAWRDALRRRMLAAADALTILAAASLGALVGEGIGALWIALAIPIWLVMAKLYGLYDNDHRALRHLTVDELPSIVAWATTGAATYFALIAIVGRASVSAPAAVRFWLVVMSPRLSSAPARGLCGAGLSLESARCLSARARSSWPRSASSSSSRTSTSYA